MRECIRRSHAACTGAGGGSHDPTKLLVGQILVVLAIIVAGIWFATQWAAAKLAYQSELGNPWLLAFGRPIYRPWRLFGWWYQFDAYAPRIFSTAGIMVGASGFAGCAATIAGSLWRARQHGNVTTYGSARWASLRDTPRGSASNSQKLASRKS